MRVRMVGCATRGAARLGCPHLLLGTSHHTPQQQQQQQCCKSPHSQAGAAAALAETALPAAITCRPRSAKLAAESWPPVPRRMSGSLSAAAAAAMDCSGGGGKQAAGWTQARCAGWTTVDHLTPVPCRSHTAAYWRLPPIPPHTCSCCCSRCRCSSSARRAASSFSAASRCRRASACAGVS